MKRTNLYVGFLLLLIIFFKVESSYCQLVNVEKRRQKIEDTLVGTFGISANILKNTKEVILLNGNLSIDWNIKKTTLLFYSEFSYNKVNDQILVNDSYQHLRYNHKCNRIDFLVFELFAQNQYNMIKLLEHRNIIGSGFRFRLHDSQKFYLYFSPLFMFEREELSDGLQSINKKFKGDFYTSAGYYATPTLKISHVTYYQPDISNFMEFRIMSETSLVFKISKKLAFSFDFSISYDSNPPVDYKLEYPLAIPKLFYIAKNGLFLNF
jgi:hypothetical protein